jgi:ArsR family transcriptional regulator, arsenate/arsenite/antimonite-responsive transcriptional repressor
MAVDVAVDRSSVLKALAEPVRWRIIERLADDELCVCHLVDDLGLAQPLVSHHLKVLRDAGLVTSERFKQWAYYRLDPTALERVADELRFVANADRTRPQRRPCC